jgi:hypothetical protein
MTAVRPIYPEDWALRLEADFDEYMSRLYESSEGDVSDDDAVDAAGLYYCGCSTCERRASWTFLMVRVMEAYRDGIIALEEDSPKVTESKVDG